MEKKYSKASANILLEAANLQEKKGNDYNNPNSTIKQADYYPNGFATILDIMNIKVLRMRSIVEASQFNDMHKCNFESLEDSCLDLINYASFGVAYLRGELDGQNINKDIFNKDFKNEILWAI